MVESQACTKILNKGLEIEWGSIPRLSLVSMNMGVYANLRESFDTSQEKRIANPVLLIFLSSELRLLYYGKKKGMMEGRKKREKEEKDTFS